MCPERRTGIILPSRKLVPTDGLGGQGPQRLQKNHYPLRESALPRDRSGRILQTEGRGQLTDVQSHTLAVHSPQAVLFYSRLAFPKCCSVSLLPDTSVEPPLTQWDGTMGAAHVTVSASSEPLCPLLPSNCLPTLLALLPLS